VEASVTEKHPVITVDGPGGVGKGTVSRHIAQALGWHFLDSGALYRVLALAAIKHNIELDDENRLQQLARNLAVVFVQDSPDIFLEGEPVSAEIRTEACGNAASKVARFMGVREALLENQRTFAQPPGLVADGRDMGTVIFPEALLKIFLEATPEIRAKRRQLQLKEQGLDVSLDGLLREILERDSRDRGRAIAPLLPAADAVVIDTSTLSIQEVCARVMALARERGV